MFPKNAVYFHGRQRFKSCKKVVATDKGNLSIFCMMKRPPDYLERGKRKRKTRKLFSCCYYNERNKRTAEKTTKGNEQSVFASCNYLSKDNCRQNQYTISYSVFSSHEKQLPKKDFLQNKCFSFPKIINLWKIAILLFGMYTEAVSIAFTQFEDRAKHLNYFHLPFCISCSSVWKNL